MTLPELHSGCQIRVRRATGRAEGKRPGLAQRLANDLLKRGYGPRVCTLGHTQRGGAPTAHDRMLASMLGASAIHFLLGGRSGAMVGVQNDQVVLVPFKNVIGQHRELPTQLLNVAQVLAS